MKVGYRRVSTIDQNLDRQDMSGLDRIFEDKASGKDTDRVALQEMIAFVRTGDEILVHSIDRLARDLRDLQSIITTLNEKGVSVEFISERLLFSGDASDPFAQLQLQIIGSVAQFERAIIRKRQAEGIAKAKERGVYENRKRKSTINVKRVKGLRDECLNNTEIAAHMGISRLSVYRSLNS
jgi:DNA invertase Pin-like site-specific DNA recombinase